MKEGLSTALSGWRHAGKSRGLTRGADGVYVGGAGGEAHGVRFKAVKRELHPWGG